MSELPTSAEGRWDSYPCLVDDAAASILVDLAWAERGVPAALSVCYVARLRVLEPADHGMGSEAEAARLHDLEDGLVPKVEALGPRFVARMRSLGQCEWFFFGAAADEEALEDLLEPMGAQLLFKEDAGWSGYTDFLYPDVERLRWMRNRSLVDQLVQHGDDGSTPRTIEHFAFFPTAAAAGAYAEAATALGFRLHGEPHATEAGAVVVQLNHEGKATLDVLHAEVMKLERAAAERGGDYDGWGCNVV